MKASEKAKRFRSFPDAHRADETKKLFGRFRFTFIKNAAKFSVIFLIIFGWTFSGWPRVYNFPPTIQVAQAAVAFRAASAKAAGTGAVTPALPTGVAANDIIILVASTIAGGSLSITANGSISAWTEITSGGVDVTGGEKLYVWWGRYSSGSTGPTVTPGSDHANAATIAYSGAVTSGSPIDVSATGSEATSDTSFSFATGISTTVDGTLALVAYSSGVDSNTGQGGTPANTSLGSVTLRIEYETASGLGGGYVLADGVKATAGSLGTWTDTMVSATPKSYVSFALKPQNTTTIGDGTNPSDAIIAPGATVTEIDAFTFITSIGTDSITQATTTFSADISAGVSEVQITNDAGSTTYGTSTLSGTAASISLNGLTASTTTTQYKIRIIPKSHSAMPTPPGAEYTALSIITAWTGTNTQAGSDLSSAIITIDNLSPNGATATSTSAGNQQITLSWTTSNSSDFSRSVVLRWASSTIGSEVPTEGTDYSVNNTIGSSTVACVRTGDISSTAVSGIDGAGTGGCSANALTNGQAYSYKVFQKDSNGNYDVGASMGSATPVVSTVSCAVSTSTTSFGSLDTSAVYTSSPNASTSMTCDGAAGCALYVQDAGNGSQPGLYKSVSPTYLIKSPNAAFNATATLAVNTDGYGIQAATTTAGSGGTLTIAQRYLQTGDTVGGLATTTTILASSSAAVTSREVLITHKAAVGIGAFSGSYTDTITYSCILN